MSPGTSLQAGKDDRDDSLAMCWTSYLFGLLKVWRSPAPGLNQHGFLFAFQEKLSKAAMYRTV